MIHEFKKSKIFNIFYQRLFENGAINPAGDLITAGIGRPTKKSNWQDTRQPWAYPYYTLSLLIGEGKASYRNENGFQCAVSFGDFFITFPDTKQQYAPAIGESWGEICVCFTGTIFDTLRQNGVITPQKPVWHLDKAQPWIDHFQAFLQEPVPHSSQHKLRRAVYFMNHLLKMMEEATPVQPIQPDVDWFDRACNLLTDDLHNDVDLQAVANELMMSYNTFRIYFKRRAGVSPRHYRTTARLDGACRYLRETQVKTCNEIAFFVGYSSEQRFFDQFKRHIGMTPNEYRKKHRED